MMDLEGLTNIIKSKANDYDSDRVKIDIRFKQLESDTRRLENVAVKMIEEIKFLKSPTGYDAVILYGVVTIILTLAFMGIYKLFEWIF